VRGGGRNVARNRENEEKVTHKRLLSMARWRRSRKEQLFEEGNK
jgi:hypothetical protein